MAGESQWKLHPCKITFAGQPIVNARPDMLSLLRDVFGLRRINYFTIPTTASAYGEGYFLVDRPAMVDIIKSVVIGGDAAGYGQLIFDSFNHDKETDSTERVVIPYVFVGPRCQQIKSIGGGSLYILHLVDQRYIWTKFFNLGASYYNMVMADPTLIFDETIDPGEDETSDASAIPSGEWTWNRLINDIYVNGIVAQEAEVITPTLTIPSGDPISNPRDLVFSHVPAPIALDQVMAQNGWIFVYDPFTAACRIDDFAQSSTWDILSQLGRGSIYNRNIHRRFYGGGFSHKKFNFLDGAFADDAEYGKSSSPMIGHVGADLLALPLPTITTLPRYIRIIFPNKFVGGAIPTDQADGAAAKQFSSITLETDELIFDELTTSSDIYKQYLLQKTRNYTVLTYRDTMYAVLEGSAPYESITNASTIQQRAEYIAKRVLGKLINPAGESVYHGWHTMVLGREIMSITYELVGYDGNPYPITRVNARQDWPKMMFGRSLDEIPTAHEIVGVNGTVCMQRPDGSYAIAGGGGGSSATPSRRLVYKSQDGDYYVCRSWDGYDEGDTDIYVAKRPDLVRSTHDGLIKSGSLLMYEFTSDYARNAYAGITGTLTTRTDYNSGVITKTSHGLLTSYTVNVAWLPFTESSLSISATITAGVITPSGLESNCVGKFRRGDLITVSGAFGERVDCHVVLVATSEITVSGGTGDALPTDGASITIDSIYHALGGGRLIMTIPSKDSNTFNIDGGTGDDLPPDETALYYVRRGTSLESQEIFPTWYNGQELNADNVNTGILDANDSEITLQCKEDRDWGAA